MSSSSKSSKLIGITRTLSFSRSFLPFTVPFVLLAFLCRFSYDNNVLMIRVHDKWTEKSGKSERETVRGMRKKYWMRHVCSQGLTSVSKKNVQIRRNFILVYWKIEWNLWFNKTIKRYLHHDKLYNYIMKKKLKTIPLIKSSFSYYSLPHCNNEKIEQHWNSYHQPPLFQAFCWLK